MKKSAVYIAAKESKNANLEMFLTPKILQERVDEYYKFQNSWYPDEWFVFLFLARPDLPNDSRLTLFKVTGPKKPANQIPFTQIQSLNPVGGSKIGGGSKNQRRAQDVIAQQGYTPDSGISSISSNNGNGNTLIVSKKVSFSETALREKLVKYKRLLFEKIVELKKFAQTRNLAPQDTSTYLLREEDKMKLGDDDAFEYKWLEDGYTDCSNLLSSISKDLSQTN